MRVNKGKLAEIRALVASMSRHSTLYRMLKDELLARGNWKNAPRGKPIQTIKTQRRIITDD